DLPLAVGAPMPLRCLLQAQQAGLGLAEALRERVGDAVGNVQGLRAEAVLDRLHAGAQLAPSVWPGVARGSDLVEAGKTLAECTHRLVEIAELGLEPG